MKRVKSAILFDNGNLAVCDEDGEQIPELQGTYSLETHKRILLEALDDCEFTGFEKLPPGFIRSVKGFVNYFKNRQMSWQEIQNL